MRVEHLAALVAAPVGAGDRGELHHADPPGGGAVRTPAEVDEGAVAVERDGLRAVVPHQVLDQLHLVGLIGRAEPLDRLRRGQVGPLERLIGLDVRAHPLLDPVEVGLGRAEPVRELEVVVEAVGDRRPDRDLRPRPELDDRGGEDVGGVVAQELQGLGGAVGHDLDLGAVRKRRRQVAHGAVQLHREGSLGQPGPDRGRRVGAGRAVGQLEVRAIGELHAQRSHPPYEANRAPGSPACLRRERSAGSGHCPPAAGGGPRAGRARRAGRRAGR